jgi:hypothetical protein
LFERIKSWFNDSCSDEVHNECNKHLLKFETCRLFKYKHDLENPASSLKDKKLKWSR